MSHNATKRTPLLACLVSFLMLSGCGGESGDGDVPSQPVADRPVTIASVGPNAVSQWADIAARTVNATSAVNSTPEEQRSVYATDMATVQVAVYDALAAIDGHYKAYAITPVTPATGASMPAAVAAATYGVLRVLFPDRSDQYAATYTSFIAGIADGDAKTRGVALGTEVAAGIVALRAGDGRSIVLPTYVPGTTPGRFRGVNPINRYLPSIKPFALTSNSQFRPNGPPALESAAYTAAFNETKTIGSAASTTRTADQLVAARFNTEAPSLFFTRNFNRLAQGTTDLPEAARLLAFIYVVHSDATNACFEAKYTYDFWRPLSAIPLADTDNNPATVADPSWTPVVPTPNHPEYPAAHASLAAGVAETLHQFYGSTRVTFAFDSTVTGTTRSYASLAAYTDEDQLARIAGGMHFRTSTADGNVLGTQVALWTAQRYFKPRS